MIQLPREYDPVKIWKECEQIEAEIKKNETPDQEIERLHNQSGGSGIRYFMEE